jgi:DNA-binding MarR family transcriptional regulator
VDDTRWLDSEEQRTWRSFLTANRLFFDRIERQLQADSGLPHAYFEILVRLSEAPDRTLRMSDLAASSLSSRSRLSHAVARMEEAGWVRRRACPTDKRGQFAELTDEGFERLDAAARGHVEEVRTLLFDVLTPEQQKVLREISDIISAPLGDERRL